MDPLTRILAGTVSLWLAGQGLGCLSPWARASYDLLESRYAAADCQYDKAEELAWRALESRRKLHGAAHVEVADVQIVLSEYLARRGALDEAAGLATEALAIYERSDEATPAQLSQAWQVRAAVAEKRQDLEEAESRLERARESCKRTGPASDDCLLRSDWSLRLFYRRNGRYEEAEAYELARYDEDITGARRGLDPDRDLEITDFYREYGGYAEAVRYHESAMEGWQERRDRSQDAPGPERKRKFHYLLLGGPSVRVSSPPQARRFFDKAPPGLDDYADLLDRIGDADRAARLRTHERALWARPDELEAKVDHWIERCRDNGWRGSTLGGAHAAAGYYHLKKGDPDRAVAEYRRALSEYEAERERVERYGGLYASDDYQETLLALGELHESRGDGTEAERFYRSFLAAVESTRNDRHRWRLEALIALANLYRDAGRHGEAERFYERHLRLAETARGIGHPDYAWGLHHLAALRLSQDRRHEAGKLEARARAIWAEYREQTPAIRAPAGGGDIEAS